MLKVGDSLVLETKHSLKPEQYQSNIVELSGSSVFIDYPVNLSTNKTVFLMDGTQLQVTYISKDGSIYIFDTEVLGKVKSTIPMIKLLFPEEEEHIKIQRREYVRVEIPVDVAVHSKEKSSKLKPFTTITDDISAGGAAILVPKGIEIIPDTILDIWFVIPLKSGELHHLKLDSKVIRLIERYEHAQDLVSLEFISISNYERQILMRFVFEKQLELRNKSNI